MSVSIEISGSRIRLEAGRPIRALSTFVPGSNFSKTGGAHWSIPLSMDSCTLLREHFGDQLKIGPKLWGWAKEQRAEERRMAALRSGDTAPKLRGLERYPALLKAVTETRPYQAIGARWIADGRDVLIGDTVGLGKTPQTIAGVYESGVPGPYLVVCPKTAVEQVWLRELQRWAPDADVVSVPDGREKRDAILNDLLWFTIEDQDPANTWVIVHPEMTRTKSWWICKGCDSETLVNSRPKELICGHDPRSTTTRHDHEYPQLFNIHWGAVIADESDKSILRAKGIPTQTRRGMEMLRDSVCEGGLRIAQSGTPFRSRPHLLWSTLNWLRPDEFPAFWRWAELFFEMQEGYAGSRIVGALRQDREAMLYRSLDRIMLRRTRAEVASHLPQKEYVGTHLFPGGPVAIWLRMDGKQEKAYRQMQVQSVADVEGGQLSAIGTLAEWTRLKQFANSYGRMDAEGNFHPALPSNKLDFLIQRLIELGYPDDPDTKVVVVSQFTQVLHLFKAAVEKEFGTGIAAMVTGGITGDQRSSMIDSFNQPIGSKSQYNPLVMFLNTKAGGSAITLDVADEMIFLDQTWIPDDQEQAEGRIDNRRPEEKIVQRRYLYLATEDSIDQYVAEVNHERGEAGRQILDGRRGVEYLRAVSERMR
jgi:SNF2 family DNA or RNA helicase